MIRVNIYRIIGRCTYDWKPIEKNKRFRSAQTAHNYCVYVAPKIHGCGDYAYVLIK